MAPSHYYLPAVEILNRFLPSYWWSDPGTTLDGPVAIGFASMLGLMLVAGIALWILAPRLTGEHYLNQRLIARLAKWIVGLAIVGLFLLLFRWQIVPFLSKRLWLILWFATLFGVAGYAGYFWKRLYPARLTAWAESERRKKYIPRAAQTSGRQRRRTRRR